MKGGTYGGVGSRCCARSSGGGVRIVVGVFLLRAYCGGGTGWDGVHPPRASVWFCASCVVL